MRYLLVFAAPRQTGCWHGLLAVTSRGDHRSRLLSWELAATAAEHYIDYEGLKTTFSPPSYSLLAVYSTSCLQHLAMFSLLSRLSLPCPWPWSDPCRQGG